jgi:cytochrome c
MSRLAWTRSTAWPRGEAVSFRILGLLLMFSVLHVAGEHPAHADAARGGQLARQWCANCHVIGSSAAGAVPQGPPTFQTVAHSGMTADQLRAFLSHPHGAMPDLALTRAEIDDLISYIDTLR